MDEQIGKDLIEHLEFLFPQSAGHRPNWSQESYRSTFFDIFQASYKRGVCPHGEQISEFFLVDNWFPNRKDLTEKDKDQVRDMFRAWTEWKYAWEKWEKKELDKNG
jgi:hypothetical protein